MGDFHLRISTPSILSARAFLGKAQVLHQSCCCQENFFSSVNNSKKKFKMCRRGVFSESNAIRRRDVTTILGGSSNPLSVGDGGVGSSDGTCPPEESPSDPDRRGYRLGPQNPKIHCEEQ